MRQAATVQDEYLQGQDDQARVAAVGDSGLATGAIAWVPALVPYAAN